MVGMARAGPVDHAAGPGIDFRRRVLCLLKAPEAQVLQPVLARLQSLTNLADALWSVLGALVGSVTGVLRNLNTWVLAGCAAMVLFGYVVCVGLGTVYFRVALARR